MEAAVKDLFARYEHFFNHALQNSDADQDEARSFYADAFVAASPAGVIAGQNDDRLTQIMGQGYARYRAIGTRGMQLRSVNVSPIDAGHCLAQVAWTATYARTAAPDLPIDFDVHYLVQTCGLEPKIFGWISGDEQALLKANGII